MVIQAWLRRFLEFFTPTKMTALMVFLFAALVNVANPFEHSVDTGSWYVPIPNFAIRTLFIFCGLFSLMGNGNTVKIRHMMVSIPMVYLSIIYLQKYIETHVHSLILPTILLCVYTAWLVLTGECYDYAIKRCPSVVDSYINWTIAKPSDKNG